MPSPFPGMDPWLESPYIWGEFHQTFAVDMSRRLNKTLPKPLYARVDIRPEIGIFDEEDGEKRRIGPDVAIVRRPNGESTAGVTTSARPISANSLEVIVASDPVKHVFVEVRDPTKKHELITMIEIASPSNKRAGKDRKAYLRKQSEVLSSTANLVEIDLLRGGKRLFNSPAISAALKKGAKRSDYVIQVSRAWTRDDEHMAFQVFPIAIDEPLPCIPVPLRQGQPEVALDLQAVFQTTYDEGPYLQGAVDYNEPADPPLPPEHVDWAAKCLRKAKVIA